ncbi:hypothetical protein TREMEDRAFT_35179, partial [Tremella mesenterica DSM 1558]|uniref:uncharacterized protein n=1 Tax=Tremella mesenterica (strain ATCC 24925 / CBS 8224 / DSM 1558 / NBRC 9311 / NRRL Y-6157 / RJB 2259-6 / UBC 559-6) TaxID=578456 RepID=UPI00032CD938
QRKITMATLFAKASFDVAAYVAARPTYPQKLYDLIYSYHSSNGGKFDHALDLGCGPGFIALNLAQRFPKVTALDTSVKMLSSALQPPPSFTQINYQVSSAESISTAPGLEKGVDLVIAGQAAHWFDHSKVWKELSRVVKPKGTVAYIVSSPYWSQPGRSIVEGLLDSIPFPIYPSSTSLSIDLNSLPSLNGGHPINSTIQEPLPPSEEIRDSDRDWDSDWDSSTALRLKSSSKGPWALQKSFTWENLEEYLRSWSSYASYLDAHPEERQFRGKGAQGDLVDRLLVNLKTSVGQQGEAKNGVEVAWPVVLMLIKKK